jgi:hypothetical protein
MAERETLHILLNAQISRNLTAPSNIILETSGAVGGCLYLRPHAVLF